ncbi:amino acid ABC transporter substrate-binding protein [Salinibacterium sp. TMP30]|uniref:amino acid ABC transporter substrate-binding protein n=1 Tax=Salinibacterium sp. TMP30 TaxID=3138237 RepID=UPI0031398858
MNISKKWRSRFFAPVAVASAMALALVGCSPDAGTPSDSSEDPIVIGGTLGLTGVFSGPSAGYVLAYEFWLDEVNASGGIDGRQVELIIYDDESTPTVAQQLYQRLINEDDVDLLLAPYTTAVGGAVVPIAERAGVLMINAGFVGKEIHQTADLLVSTWPYQDIEYSLGMFEYLDTLPESEMPKTLAVVTAQNPFTLAALEGFDGEGGVLNYAEERGIEVVVNEQYDQTATDVSSLIETVKASGADMFVALSLPNDAALIANTVNEAGYNPDVYCSCGSQVTSLPNWPDLGVAGINVFASSTAFPTQGYPGLQEVSDYVAEQQGVPGAPAYSAVAYAAGQVIQQAIEGAGTLDSNELRDYIANNTFSTAVGDITYNEDGTIDFSQILLQYQEDGGNQLIWPIDAATATAIMPLR